MSTVSKFIGDEKEHEVQLAHFMCWEYIESQGKGSSYDYIAPDGSKIEAKFDWDSIKTANHYLEIAQTSDNKETWVPSGFSISADEANLWVVINEDWVRIFQIEVLKEYLNQNRSKSYSLTKL